MKKTMTSTKNGTSYQYRDEFIREAKTCYPCLDKSFKGRINRNSQCPECHKHLTIEQLNLSPYHVKSWKCNLCSRNGIGSPAENWCHDCQKAFCTNCSGFHQIFHPKHNAKDVDEMERDEMIRAVMTHLCPLHLKERDSYCQRCNMCLCDTCYKEHPTDFPGCSSRPLSVRIEAKKQKSQGPTLAIDMDNLEMDLKRLNENVKKQAEELNSDCDLKCAKLRLSLDEMIENAMQRTDELCEEMKQITAEQVNRRHQLLAKNENILKELAIWRDNFNELMNDSQKDVDILCGLRSLKSTLFSLLHKSVRTDENCQLGVTFPNWWLKVTEQLKKSKIGSVYLTFDLPAKKFIFDKQFNLNRPNMDITSIHVKDEDNHFYVCDFKTQSVIEFTERGELVCECRLLDGTNQFTPWDICSTSQDNLAVACGEEKKMIFLEKRKFLPLKIKKIVSTNREFFSLCAINKSIFACDHFFQIDSFTEEGTKIKTIVPGGAKGGLWPRIRADLSTGNFWGAKLDSSEIFCFNPDGKKLRSVKTDEIITDFCVQESGYFYFCNYEGIFSFSPKNTLYKFTKKSEYHRRIFALQNSILVCFRTDRDFLIKIFKEFQQKRNKEEMNGMEETKVLGTIKTKPEIFPLHQKPRCPYCKERKRSLCKICHLNHSNDSLKCWFGVKEAGRYRERKKRRTQFGNNPWGAKRIRVNSVSSFGEKSPFNEPSIRRNTISDIPSNSIDNEDIKRLLFSSINSDYFSDVSIK